MAALPVPLRRSVSLSAAALLGLIALLGCTEPPPPARPDPAATLAGKFTFEPRLGTAFRHTARRVDQFEVVGAPLREVEESELVWDTTITSEDNKYRYTFRAVRTCLKINGAAVYDSKDGCADLSASGAEVVLLMNGDATITEMRGAATLSAALLEVTPAAHKATAARQFAPEVLERLIVQRVVERSADLLGNFSNVGASWGAVLRTESGQEPVAKELRVTDVRDCAAVRCVVVERQLLLDRQLAWEAARARVEAFVAREGGDPSQVSLIDVDLVLEDELVVDPRTLEFHGARFEQSATVTVQSPKGRLTVRSSSVRTSTYDYAL
jgi:hypothetical protein